MAVALALSSIGGRLLSEEAYRMFAATLLTLLGSYYLFSYLVRGDRNGCCESKALLPQSHPLGTTAVDHSDDARLMEPILQQSRESIERRLAAEDRAAAFSLIALTTLSPCLGSMPMLLALANPPIDWTLVAAAATVLAVTSAVVMGGLVAASMLGASRMDFSKVRRHERLVLGVGLIVLGCVTFLVLAGHEGHGQHGQVQRPPTGSFGGKEQDFGEEFGGGGSAGDTGVPQYVVGHGRNWTEGDGEVGGGLGDGSRRNGSAWGVHPHQGHGPRKDQGHGPRKDQGHGPRREDAEEEDGRSGGFVKGDRPKYNLGDGRGSVEGSDGHGRNLSSAEGPRGRGDGHGRNLSGAEGPRGRGDSHGHHGRNQSGAEGQRREHGGRGSGWDVDAGTGRDGIRGHHGRNQSGVEGKHEHDDGGSHNGKPKKRHHHHRHRHHRHKDDDGHGHPGKKDTEGGGLDGSSKSGEDKAVEFAEKNTTSSKRSGYGANDDMDNVDDMVDGSLEESRKGDIAGGKQQRRHRRRGASREQGGRGGGLGDDGRRSNHGGLHGQDGEAYGKENEGDDRSGVADGRRSNHGGLHGQDEEAYGKENENDDVDGDGLGVTDAGGEEEGEESAVSGGSSSVVDEEEENVYPGPIDGKHQRNKRNGF